MSRTRVLFVLGSLEANDLGDEIVTILGRLPRSDFDPGVVALGGREDLRGRIVEMQVRFHALGLSGPFGAWRAAGRVRNLLSVDRADVVHGFGSWGGSVAQLAAPEGVAIVRSVTQPPNHEKDLRGRVLQYLEKKARRRAGGSTRFVVPNEGSKGLAVKAYGAPEIHVSVLPRSIDAAKIRDRVARSDRAESREVLGIRDGETAFVMLTGFDSGARMDQILAGFQMAVRERPGLRMFMVGSGRYEGSTRWKVEELQLGDSVVFLGHGTEAGPIWSAADVAIDASPWASWSRPALIAIAAGLPTLKRQDGVGGWSEELDEHLPMILGDPDRFAADLISLADDAAVREPIREHGEGVVRRVDVANVVEELGGLYRTLSS